MRLPTLIPLLFAFSFGFASRLDARESLAAFVADSVIDVQNIYAAARAANTKPVASYAPDQGSDKKVDIFADWEELEGAAPTYFFEADMDVDCDGAEYQCAGNSDGQGETSFGHLDATKVPYIVLPLSFTEKYKKTIKPNALCAVVCNGNMFYAIYGDQNGATPEVIGEGSLLLAQTCFPKDKISGSNGHDPLDVLYIVFGTAVVEGVGDKTINIPALKALGDKEVSLLQAALQIGKGLNETVTADSINDSPDGSETQTESKAVSTQCSASSHQKRNKRRLSNH